MLSRLQNKRDKQQQIIRETGIFTENQFLTISVDSFIRGVPIHLAFIKLKIAKIKIKSDCARTKLATNKLYRKHMFEWYFPCVIKKYKIYDDADV